MIDIINKSNEFPHSVIANYLQSLLMVFTILSTIFIEKLRNFFIKPKLKLEIAKPYEENRNQENTSDQFDGDIMIKVGIKNIGTSTAKECKCIVDKIEMHNADDSISNVKPLLNLEIGWNKNESFPSIFKDDIAYIDLAKLTCQYNNTESNKTKLESQSLCLAVLCGEESEWEVFNDPCNIDIRINIKYNNSYKTSFVVNIKWNGGTKLDIARNFSIREVY